MTIQGDMQHPPEKEEISKSSACAWQTKLYDWV